MSSYKDIKQQLENKETKKGKLSAKSIELYLKLLKRLNDGDEWKNLNFLKNSNSIDNIINDYQPQTQKNYYSSIVSVLNNQTGFKKVLEHYKNKMMELKDNINKEYESNEMNEKQKVKYGNVKWEDIEKRYNDLTEKVDKLKRTDFLKERHFKTLLNHLVSSFYVLIPPRRNQDIQNLYLGSGDDSKNWVDLKNKKLIFNVFKTSKSTEAEDKIVSIPQKLEDVINRFVKVMKLKNGDPLIIDMELNHLNKINSINRILTKALGFGSSDLRHIYLSSKYGNTLTAMKNDADKMGHSVETQKQYIKV